MTVIHPIGETPQAAPLKPTAASAPAATPDGSQLLIAAARDVTSLSAATAAKEQQKPSPQKPAGADTFTPLIDDDVMTADVMKEVKNATKSIHFETYLLNGPDGKALADLLIQKKDEGLTVRVLLDPAMQKIESKMQKGDPKYQLVKYLKANGVQCECYPVKKLKGSLTPSEHAKALIIDDRIAYIGGSNIDDTYNHDINVKIEGPSARYIRSFFDESWKVTTHPDPDLLGYTCDPTPERSDTVKITTTSPSRSTVKGAVLKNINDAKESILVEMFTLTDDDIEKALLAAKKRGVDVRVILCDNKEIFHVPTFHVPNLSAAIKFYDAGIPVRWYVNDKFTQMHSKLAIFDHQKVMLGSTNWIHHAFKGIHEYTGEFDDGELAGKLEGQFEADWNTHGKDVDRPTLLQRLLGGVVEAVDGLIF